MLCLATIGVGFVTFVNRVAGEITFWGFLGGTFFAPILFAPEKMQSKEIIFWLVISTLSTALLWIGLSGYFTRKKHLSKILGKLNDEKQTEREEMNGDGFVSDYNRETRYVWLRGVKTDISNAYQFCYGIFILSFLLFVFVSGGIEELRGEDRTFPICSDGQSLTDKSVMDGIEDCLGGEDEDPLVQLSRCIGLECDGVTGYLVDDYVSDSFGYVMLMTGTTAIGVIFLVRTWTPLREMSSIDGTIEKLSIGVFNRLGLVAALTTAYSISLKISDGRPDHGLLALEYTLNFFFVALILSFPYIASIKLARKIVSKRIGDFQFSTEEYPEIVEMQLLERANGVFEVRLIQDSVSES